MNLSNRRRIFEAAVLAYPHQRIEKKFIVVALKSSRLLVDVKVQPHRNDLAEVHRCHSFFQSRAVS